MPTAYGVLLQPRTVRVIDGAWRGFAERAWHLVTQLGSNACSAMFCVEHQGISLALVFLPIKREV